MNYKQMIGIIPKPRIIMLSDTIDISNVTIAMKTIIDIDENDRLLKATYGDNYIPEAIKLYINSGGGKIHAGLGLIDTMRNSKTPVDTYCYGSAMSMASWIWMQGNQRFLGKNSVLMYHEITCTISDKINGINKHMAKADKLQDMYDSRIKLISTITQEQLNKYKESKSEWYIFAEEAIKYNLAHKIL